MAYARSVSIWNKVSVRVFKNAGEGFIVQASVGCATANITLVPVEVTGGRFTWSVALSAAGDGGHA